ncbi:hypothetical protein A6U91_26915 [Agrobacterium tumefaciens]|uniref:Uncharacterized protein n=1 Tax=Agrobacterium tumefaciens TaxID=358 RepID=A0AB36EKF6_AGRTU|nr:hypothetical protein A6U91_26915 [Agrobacterium tumefaciens]
MKALNLVERTKARLVATREVGNVNSALLRKLRSTLTGFSLMARLRSRRVPAFMRDKVSRVPNGCNVMQEQREKVMQETGICV